MYFEGDPLCMCVGMWRVSFLFWVQTARTRLGRPATTSERFFFALCSTSTYLGVALLWRRSVLLPCQN